MLIFLLPSIHLSKYEECESPPLPLILPEQKLINVFLLEVVFASSYIFSEPKYFLSVKTEKARANMLITL